MLSITGTPQKLGDGRRRCVAVHRPPVLRSPSRHPIGRAQLLYTIVWQEGPCVLPYRERARLCTVQTLEAALLDGPSLLLVVEKENAASRLAMLLQGGTNGLSTGRRMGGGASQAGALAAAAARQPLPVIFASTTPKVSRCHANCTTAYPR
jgi:hypothetical protein